MRPNGNAKLDAAIVRHMRKMVKEGKVTVAELAQVHGLSRETVRRILRRETWDWVQDAPDLSETEWQRAAAESQRRFFEANPDLLPPGAVLPPAPPAAPAEPPPETAEEKMARIVQKMREKAQAGDKMLDELTGEEGNGNARDGEGAGEGSAGDADGGVASGVDGGG